MRSTITFATALALAFLCVGAVAGVSMAQTEGSEVLEACKKGKDQISAEKLPSEVSLENCPIEDRPIVDNGVEAVLPEPGKGVHAEVLLPGGSQELVVARHKDGTVELNRAGDDAAQAFADNAKAILFAAARGSNECRQRAYNLTRWRVYGGLRYRYNFRSTPRYLRARTVAQTVRRGGVNIIENRNSCRIKDKVEVSLRYQGNIRRAANILANGRCTRPDGQSVVAFGDQRRALAVTCTYFTFRRGYERVTSADIELDRTGNRWTTRPFARSCRNRYDIQAVATHEWGHVFGLAHVPERRYRNLTMSPIINGTCQASERTLGRGDVRGLARKYR